jgi:hypothetical protein
VSGVTLDVRVGGACRIAMQPLEGELFHLVGEYLVVDVTDPADGEAAVAAAVDRFGRIDVLVDRADNFNADFFEELSPDEFRPTFFGPCGRWSRRVGEAGGAGEPVGGGDVGTDRERDAVRAPGANRAKNDQQQPGGGDDLGQPEPGAAAVVR